MSSTTAAGAPPSLAKLNPQRWTALIFIALAQLMVVLDATIVNIAMPSAQTSLDISDGNKQWMITAYSLAFGGLLLFGGRISDLWGRKRAFIIGLLGFAGASALGGAAANEAMLFSARALQGAFGALLAPAALSLLAITFTEPKERAKAFGIYGAVAGGGAAIGLILGGLLTEYLDWRWTFFVNTPMAIIAALGAVAFVHDSSAGSNRDRLDIPGVLLATTGLVSLVYGFTKAESDGWGAGLTVGLFAAAGVLLVSFVLVERWIKAPLLPLRVVSDRNRGGAYASIGLAIIGMFGLFLFLTYYLQEVRGYSPVKTGLAFLPMVAGMITGSTQIGARLMNHVPPRLLMAPGLLTGAVAMLLLTQIDVGSSYTGLVLPAELLLGLGMGTAFMPGMSLATLGVQPRDAGIASAMVNTSQQVGGAIGIALLNTIAATSTSSYLASRVHGRPTQALINAASVHGYAHAIWWAVGILVLAAVIAGTLINTAGPGRGRSVSGEEDDVEDSAPPVIVH